MGLKEKLQARKEKANQSTEKASVIPYEDRLYLFGEVLTVKLLKCPTSGESMHEMYKTIIKKDVNGKDISVKFGEKIVNKVQWNSPLTTGGKDEINEYRSRIWKENDETTAKKLTENAKKPKAINWVNADLLVHNEHQDTRKATPFNSHMVDFIMDAMCPDPIKETIKENSNISIKTAKYVIPNEYVAKSIGESTIECDNTITDVELSSFLVIAGKKFSFTGISGNTFTGVQQVTYSEDDIFGYDSEYVLQLTPKVELDGQYNNYSVESEFIKIADVKSISSVGNIKKYSDYRDVEAIKKSITWNLTDGDSAVQTYEQSYYKFHKYFLLETDDVIKKALADMKAGNVANTETTTERPKAEPTEVKTETVAEAKPVTTKLNIDKSALKETTEFEKKMEAVETKAEPTVLSTETPKAEPKQFSLEDVTLEGVGV